MESGKRLEYLDIAKGIAILSIIVGHMGIDSINRIVYTYHIPVFLLISGYFINETRSIKEYVISRFLRLMIPYIVTCAVIIVLGTFEGALNGDAIGELKRWLFASLYGAGNTYLYPFYIPQIGAIWFLPASFIATSIVKYTLKLDYRIRVILIAVAFALGYCTSKMFFWFPMSIQAGLCCSLYVYLGWLAGKIDFTGIDSEIKTIGTFVLSVIWIRFVFDYQGFLISRNYYGKGFWDVLASLAGAVIIIGFSYAFRNDTSFIKRIIAFFGRYSLLILCIHIIELNLFPWDRLIIDVFGFSVDFFSVILIFIKPILIMLIAGLLLRIRFIKRIFGYA